MSTYYISFSYLKFGIFLRIGDIVIDFTNIENVDSLTAIDACKHELIKNGYKAPVIINLIKLEK